MPINNLQFKAKNKLCTSALNKPSWAILFFRSWIHGAKRATFEDSSTRINRTRSSNYSRCSKLKTDAWRLSKLSLLTPEPNVHDNTKCLFEKITVCGRLSMRLCIHRMLHYLTLVPLFSFAVLCGNLYLHISYLQRNTFAFVYLTYISWNYWERTIWKAAKWEVKLKRSKKIVIK